jgi:hypothetical protein
MKRLFRGTVTLAGSLALAGGVAMAAAVPAAAGGAQDNFAYGSYAPTGAITGGPNDLAVAPPADTDLAYNVNINGLLTTGKTTDTAGLASAYAKVTNVSAATSWTAGLNTDTFTIAASQVATYCGSNQSFPANTISGTLTEDSVNTLTGVVVSHQVFNLPQLPALNQTYSFGGATVVLNNQVTVNGVLEIRGVSLTAPGTPPQTLRIAVVGCGTGSSSGAITNGNFTSSGTGGTPTGWTTTASTGDGTVTVVTNGGPGGTSNAASLQAGTGGGTAVMSQSFIADGNQLAFDYKQACTGSAGSLAITLLDSTTNTTGSLVGAGRCATDSAFQHLLKTLTNGDSYTLTFSNTATASNLTSTLVANVAVNQV